MKMKEIHRTWYSLILLVVSLPAVLLSQTPRYKVTRIDEPMDRRFATSGALNGNSLVAGVGNRGLFYWQNGSVTLPPACDTCNNSLEVRGLNNSGVAIGYYMYCDDSNNRAYRWTLTTCTDMTGQVGHTQAYANGINSKGKIVGEIWPLADTARVFMYDGSLNILPIIGDGRAINDSDYVVGTFHGAGTSAGGGFLYRNGNLTSLPQLDMALDISNRNQIVGCTNYPLEGFLWEKGNVTSLGKGIIPIHINDSGMVLCRNLGVAPECQEVWKNGLFTNLNDLIPPDSGIYVEFSNDINNRGEILCSGTKDGITYYFYLLSPIGVTLNSPAAGGTWIAGERDTIRWEGKGPSLLIEYSTDDGQTYQAIAGDVPADSGKCAWDTPKDILSAKCFIRLRDFSTLDSLAVSDQFRIKPYVLTRVGPSTGDYIAYDITRDRWGFANELDEMWPYLYWYSRFSYNPGIDPFTNQPYPSWKGDPVFSNANDSDYPDWVSFVRAFTVDACYISLPLAVYSQTAVSRWWGVSGPWGGSCFGIAGTNALAFMSRDGFLNKFPKFPLSGDAISVHSDTTVIPAVTEIFTHQFGKLSTDNDIACKLKTPTETLRDLREMLRQDESPVRTLTIFNNKGKGGHTILAYKIDRASNASPVWNVHVYDNSHPDVPDAIIEIDTSQNSGQGTWMPTYGWANWGGTKGIYLEVPSENYLGNATLAKRRPQPSPFSMAPGMLEMTATREASVRIKDEVGNVTGFAEDRVWSDIPGSTPLIVKNGSETPPYGYMLSSGNYSITVDSFKTSESRVFFFTENRTLGYRRSGAGVSQTDNLRFDTTASPTLSIANPDSQTKSIMLKSILNETAQERIYVIYALELARNDSTIMTNTDADGLKLESYGSAKDYDIRIEHASTAGLRTFDRRNVPISANTTHTIVPDWNTLGDSLLTILVDVGNDGMIDDTLHLKNEATGVGQHGSLIPGEYRLEQNFPNPFNPTTTIRYGLPQKSAVRLTVYNLLGQEVATLVQEEQEAGYHAVSFNGSALASGMYIYQIRAEKFVATRKMLLLR